MSYLLIEKKAPDNQAEDDQKELNPLPKPRPGAILLGGNMAGATSLALTQEFGISRALRPDCKRPVWHCSLSLPVAQYLYQEKWQETGASLMRKVGMDPALHQWTMVAHGDTDHQHVHIVASRIGLDGSIWHGKWEARKVQKACQELEKEMGLTITYRLLDQDHTLLPAPEQAPPVRITQKEMKKWERLGVDVPPRLAIAVAIDHSLAHGNGTIEGLKADLAKDGITAHVNQASTGRISGVSFSMKAGGEEVRYKASQLHKQYAWKQLNARLKDRRIEYGQDTSLETNGRNSASKAADPSGGSDHGTETLARELRQAAGSDLSGDRGKATSPGGFTADHRRDNSGPEIGDPGAGHRDYSTGDFRDEGSYREMEQGLEAHGRGPLPVQEPVPKYGQNSQGPENAYPQDQSLDRRLEELHPQFGTSDEENSKQLPCGRPDHRPDHNLSYDRHAVDLGEDLVVAWNTKFKQTSAAKRRAREQKAAAPSRQPVPSHQVQDARAVDPRPMFERYGMEVRQVGKQYSIRRDGDELYRSTFKGDHWVHRDHYGNGIGDNIAMIQELNPALQFIHAVYELHGGPSFQPQTVPDFNHMRPVMPPCNDKAQQQGRQYLENRGISQKTIEKAENDGFTAYTLDGVLFLGRNPVNDDIRSITRRAWDPEAKIQKRDLRHSDKVGFPPILYGDPSRVVLVEGGIDALGAQDFCHRQGIEAPTVIVSNSAEAIGFLEQPHVQDILKRASRVTVAFKNDPEPKTKANTDAKYDRQMTRIFEIVPATTVVQPYHPPEGCKDITDANFALANNELEARKGYRKNEIGHVRCYQDKLFQQKYEISYSSGSLEGLYIDLYPSEPGVHACIFGEGVELIDRGAVLSCSGSDLQRQAEIAIEIALAKGWNLANLEINGSQEWIEAVMDVIHKKIEFSDSTISVPEERMNLG